jgi:hypothetical protein
VWLEDGRPFSDEYRRFRIREVPDGETDDYAMMQEVVGRYFDRRVREGRHLPDLVLVDGGRGQLAAAMQAMEAAGVSDLRSARPGPALAPARSGRGASVRARLQPYPAATAASQIPSLRDPRCRAGPRAGAAPALRQPRGDSGCDARRARGHAGRWSGHGRAHSSGTRGGIRLVRSAGLCGACRFGRPIRGDRGSKFLLCERSRDDRRYARYPRLPVHRCPGHAPDVSEEALRRPSEDD